MAEDADKYDFFVSYAREDNKGGWITEFVAALVAEHKRFAADRELTPFFDEHTITTGADWQKYLAHGIAGSRLFLAFLSPNYFASEWCRKEWRAWMDAEIAQHILSDGVRPIYIVEVPGLTGQGQLSDDQLAERLAELSNLPEPARSRLRSEAPVVVRHLRRRQFAPSQPFCDVQTFFDSGLDALRREDLRRVLEDLARDLDRHSDLVARAAASAGNVPAYNKHFTGRIDDLLNLRERMVDDRTGVVWGVHGLGGIGKTELAFTYAHAFASAYPGGRFYVPCEYAANLRAAMLSLSSLAEFHPYITDEERKLPGAHFAAVLRCLKARLLEKGSMLLVLDNVTNSALVSRQQTDDVTALGATLHLLATTRNPPPSEDSHWVTLGELPDADALNLLEKFVLPDQTFPSEAERAAALAIVRRLGGFTIAIEMAGAWQAAHKGTTYAHIAETIGLEDLEGPIADDASYELRRHNNERRLSAILGPVLNSLAPADRRAIEYAAFLAPDQVPLPWLRELVAADFPDAVQPTRLIADPWVELCSRLTRLGLFTEAEEDPTGHPRIVRLHRLVQKLIIRELNDETRATRQEAINQLVKARDEALQKTTNWVDARWEVEPFDALANRWADEGHDDAGWLLNQTALRWDAVAQWAKVEPLMSRALAIHEASYGKDHPTVAICLNNLAQLLQATNRLGEAEPLKRRALAIDEASYGKDHPKVAIRLNNLAGLLQTTNRLGEAEPLMRRALAIDETYYGNDHPDVATKLNNLAQLLQATNRLGEAEPLMARVVDIFEKSYGGSHPNVATALSNLAQLLKATNRLGEAEPLMRRALAIDQAYYGRDHPNVARDLSNLAQLLEATNRLREAEPFMRGALAIDEASYGNDHPAVARDFNNLAMLLYATNRLGEAEPLMRGALAIDEASYGNDHPEVAIRLNNLAQLLKAANRLGEAEPLMRRGLAIDEASYGKDHPAVARDLNNLALLLKATNRLGEAEPLMRRALAIDEASYGKDHPRVAIGLNNLATLLYATNRLGEAEPLMARVVEIFEKSYGGSHPNVATALNNLAQLLQETNRLGEAEPLMRRALAIDAASYGKDHPRVAIGLNNLARLLQATNRPGEAEPLLRRALAIDEASYGNDHPVVATKLNNLAQLLKATNRLGEAEPLMRRHLEIFLQFTRETGHEHPHLQDAKRNYAELLRQIGRQGGLLRRLKRWLLRLFP